MNWIKAFVIAAVIVTAILAAFWQFALKDQVEYARLAAAYGAKKVCSCRFVAELPMEMCLRDFTQNIDLVRFDEVNAPGLQSVESRVLVGLIRAKAVHEPNLGCTLVRE